MAAAPGVLRGGRLYRVGDVWYQMYQFPSGSGQYLAYKYDNIKQLYAAYGGKAKFNQSGVKAYKRTESWFQKATIAVGQAEEVIGSWGSWSKRMDTLMQEAARDAGVRDPSLAGRIASNAEMQRIMAAAVVGKMTKEEIKAEQRKTKFWQNVLYPGIANLYDRTTEPEKAWAEYRNQVEPALRALGYSPDSSGTLNNQIKKMLDKNIDSGVFLSQVPTFIQAKQNAEFASVLNQWVQRDLGKSVGFEDWFNLMAGESQPELEAVAERAQLEWVAQNQGAQLTQAQIEDLADRSQLSAQEAQAAFSEFNQGVLALGEHGLKKYGLSRDEVLSAAAGITPASGRSVDEVKLLVAKTAREQAMFDEDKINFYVGFNPTGQPTRPGLQSLRPEGA